MNIGWTDTTLLFLCLCPCLSGKFAWARERLLGGKQAEHFPVHICRAHRGGKILKEGCLMSYGRASHFLASVPLAAPVPMPRLIKAGVERKQELSGEGERWGICPCTRLPPGRRMWNTVLLGARIVCVGVDLHFVKKNEIRGLVSTSLQFYYLQGPLPSCDALCNSLTHLQSM